VNKLPHLGTAPHRGLQLLVGSLGWVRSGRGLGRRSWRVGTASHKCRCSESHYMPEMEGPTDCKFMIGTPHVTNCAIVCLTRDIRYAVPHVLDTTQGVAETLHWLGHKHITKCVLFPTPNFTRMRAQLVGSHSNGTNAHLYLL